MLENQETQYQLLVGVDVAATTMPVTWQTTNQPVPAPRTFTQTPDGIASLIDHLQGTGVEPAPTLIVMEATGNYVRRIMARAIPPTGRMGSEGNPWVNN